MSSMLWLIWQRVAYSPVWDSYLHHVSAVLELIAKAILTADLAKCQLVGGQGTGHPTPKATGGCPSRRSSPPALRGMQRTPRAVTQPEVLLEQCHVDSPGVRQHCWALPCDVAPGRSYSRGCWNVYFPFDSFSGRDPRRAAKGRVPLARTKKQAPEHKTDNWAWPGTSTIGEKN